MPDPSLAAASPHHPALTDSGDVPDDTPHHDAFDLTQGGAVAVICLDDKRYALRITRQRKLILTK